MPLYYYLGHISNNEILTFSQYRLNLPTANLPVKIYWIKWGLGNYHFWGVLYTFILHKGLLHCDPFNFFGFRWQGKLNNLHVMRKTSKSRFWKETAELSPSQEKYPTFSCSKCSNILIIPHQLEEKETKENTRSTHCFLIV